MNDLTKLWDEIFSEFPFTSKRMLDPKDINIELELAGVKKEEISIVLESGFLKIDVKSDRKNGSKLVSVPNYYDTDKISVKYENGLLAIKIPLKNSEQTQSKKLEIK